MNYSNSFNNLYTIIQKPEKTSEKKMGFLTTRLIKLLISFTNILKTCAGRDKLCALIQYTSKFYSTILYHTIDLENSEGVTPISLTSLSTVDPFVKYDALKNVEKSMSSGRKIFRFLRWLEDIKSIYYYIVYKDTSIRNLFKALMNLSSMFYHLFDNLVWSSNVGVISEYLVGDIKLKNTKNVFSLLRNLIKIAVDVHKFNWLYIVNRKNEEEVFEAFEKRVENFQTHLHKKLIDQAIEVRSKLRRKALDIVHSFLRICMLVYSLKLEPFYSNLHPIFTGFCGMLHSIISLYKTLYDKENSFHKFESRVNLKSKGNITNKRKKSLEAIIDELEELPESDGQKILRDDYFDNYYVDFNKDFPTNPKDVISRKTSAHAKINDFYSRSMRFPISLSN